VARDTHVYLYLIHTCASFIMVQVRTYFVVPYDVQLVQK